MERATLYAGLRAVSNKAIGKLPALSVVKITTVGNSKVSIEGMVQGTVRNFYLEEIKFRNDFDLMTVFFSSADETDAKPTSTRPHSKNYLYTSVHLFPAKQEE